MLNNVEKGDLRLGPSIKEPIYLEPGDCLLPLLPKKGLGKTVSGGISDKPFGELFFLTRKKCIEVKELIRDKCNEICQ